MIAFLCTACWRSIPSNTLLCPHCGAQVHSLDVRQFRERALETLSHSNEDAAMRAILALVARHDPCSVPAIEASVRRFTRQPHLIVGLLDTLLFVADPAAKTVAQEALDHPSWIVQKTAAQVLRYLEMVALAGHRDVNR